MTLPARVIERDHTLAKSADELMKLRWHWTLDESNAKRVGFSEYARSVGASEGRVRGDAKAWQAYQQSRDSSRSRRTAMPGAAQTPSDFRALGQLSEQKQQAAKAARGRWRC